MRRCIADTPARAVDDPQASGDAGEVLGEMLLHALAGRRQHLAERDPHWEGILKGGVYHLHKKLGVNESVMWGEYFFLEALDKALHESGPVE